jgi:hypothetical protein
MNLAIRKHLPEMINSNNPQISLEVAISMMSSLPMEEESKSSRLSQMIELEEGTTDIRNKTTAISNLLITTREAKAMEANTKHQKKINYSDRECNQETTVDLILDNHRLNFMLLLVARAAFSSFEVCD